MGLKEAIHKFTESITELTDLEVLTYTGKLEQVVDATTGKIKWDELKPTSGKLVLAAATLVRPNFNTVNFQAEEAQPGDLKAVIDLHIGAVASARNGRMALVKMFSGLIPKLGGD
jgi:hypothetical protein